MSYTDYELQHYGILGQRKGRRRYQLTDGTWTEEGKRRRRKTSDRNNRSNKSDNKNSKKSNSRNSSGNSDNNAKRVKNPSQNKLKNYETAANKFSKLNKAGSEALENQRKRDKKHVERLDLSNKTNKELLDEINREALERRYNEMFNSPEVSRGRQLAEEALSVSGDVLAVTAAGLGAAVSVKKLLGK